mmetsp:Transcript_26467/g.64491  ORF Transcript_26467/g.64491 Transcript_26467/m.64491 type:complete len:264 (+) Transcript_26467:143-934(+)
MAFIMRQRRESLVEKEDDMTASTGSSLTWTSDSSPGSWSEEDEGDTSSPLVEGINRPLHHTFTSIASKNQFPKIPYSPSRKTVQEKKLSNNDYELKNSRDVMIGSVSAVINFLRTAGVPKASADELDENLNNGHYFDVLCRVQHYVQCIPSEANDEKAAKIHLAVTAWVSLCRLKSLDYRQAFKLTNKLKMEMSGADAKKWKRLQIEMKEALKEQVDLAEQCTSCQKKLYLVQRWEKKHLQKMKRTSIIEPEGYQPLRCLIEQ